MDSEPPHLGRSLAIKFFDVVAGIGWLVAQWALDLTGSYTGDDTPDRKLETT